jgi:hypothetical protein
MMTTPTTNGARKLMESTNEVIIMKINKAEVRTNIIILSTEDNEGNFVKMWSKDSTKIATFVNARQGDLIKVLEWQ